MDFILFCVITALTMGISFLCSLSEAALYSVPLPYVKHLEETGSRAGRILVYIKDNITKAVAAILLLNTIANTAGPAIAGALVARLWGDGAVVWYAISITVAILLFSEIIPKIVGVIYCKPVSHVMAYPLVIVVKVLQPLLWITTGITNVIEPDEEKPTISHEEVLSMAAIGTEEGALDKLEGSVISNVIGLDQMLVRDVLTPRVVVFRLQESTKLSELEKDLPDWSFTRIPIFSEDDPDHLTHYVMQLDIYRELIKGCSEKTLKEIARPLTTVPELLRADKLLIQMFENNEQICAVVDEHGGLAGIITLEDLLEEIVGREIVDEYDTIGDLRTFAGLLNASRGRKKGDRIE